MEKQSISSEITLHAIIVIIADAVISYLGFLVLKAFHVTGEEGFTEVLNYSIPIWVLLLLVPIAYIIIRIFFKVIPRSKATNLSALNANDKGLEAHQSTIYFNSNSSNYFSYDFQALKAWDDKKGGEYGEKAEGKMQFTDNTIIITRGNTHGRLLLKIAKFLQDNELKSYINNDPAKPIRNIEVEFEARIAGEPIKLWTVVQPADSFEWLASTHNNLSSKEWEKYLVQLKVKGDTNLKVKLEDFDCKKLPCQYFIRNLVIRELL